MRVPGGGQLRRACTRTRWRGWPATTAFAIYPRKGEFFVFDPPGGEPLERILLPVPTGAPRACWCSRPLDGKVVAGPTAHDQEDKDDWSVRPEARDEVLPKARAMLPALEGAEPIAQLRRAAARRAAA